MLSIVIRFDIIWLWIIIYFGIYGAVLMNARSPDIFALIFIIGGLTC